MTLLLWLGFVVLILLLLALDLGVLNRQPHVFTTREAIIWTLFWAALALMFNAVIYLMYDRHWLGVGRDLGQPLSGGRAALEFLTAYVVEKSLSLDNIFVIALIFAYLGIPAELQHRVLFWGILGALLLRGGMIAGGLALVGAFSWTMYVFGGLLLVTAARMLAARDQQTEVQSSLLLRSLRRWFPITGEVRGTRFFVREEGRWAMTPLALALALVESADVLFAVDSIPAVFAVTRDPFLAFTSNVFAVLGLRSLYFALASVLARFCYLKTSLTLLIAFIGAKMILAHHYPIPASISLAVIAGILGIGLLASIWSDRARAARRSAAPPGTAHSSERAGGRATRRPAAPRR